MGGGGVINASFLDRFAVSSEGWSTRVDFGELLAGEPPAVIFEPLTASVCQSIRVAARVPAEVRGSRPSVLEGPGTKLDLSARELNGVGSEAFDSWAGRDAINYLSDS
jgi:hypothetical protein